MEQMGLKEMPMGKIKMMIGWLHFIPYKRYLNEIKLIFKFQQFAAQPTSTTSLHANNRAFINGSF